MSIISGKVVCDISGLPNRGLAIKLILSELFKLPIRKRSLAKVTAVSLLTYGLFLCLWGFLYIDDWSSESSRYRDSRAKESVCIQLYDTTVSQIERLDSLDCSSPSPCNEYAERTRADLVSGWEVSECATEGGAFFDIMLAFDPSAYPGGLSLPNRQANPGNMLGWGFDQYQLHLLFLPWMLSCLILWIYLCICLNLPIGLFRLNVVASVGTGALLAAAYGYRDDWRSLEFLAAGIVVAFFMSAIIPLGYWAFRWVKMGYDR